MTTIVTTTGNNFAAIYADSGLSSDLIHHDVRKITQQGTWLIGCAGDARQADLIHYAVKYPKPPQSLLNKPTQEWFGWIVLNVIPKIEAALELKDKDDYNFEILLITHGRAFYIATSLSVSHAEPYWAVGSGSHLAIGYLSHAQYKDNWSKDHDFIAKYAVSIAQIHDEATRGKIHGYISNKDGSVRGV
jgi:20S proteasome alpha/beta subunit